MRSWPACRWVLLVLFLVGFLPTASLADTVTVTVSRGNVRAGPGVTHRVLTSVPQGATFSILATKQGWHQIRLNDGRNGWIAGSIVQVDWGVYPKPLGPKTLRNSIGMEFVLILAGEFLMGSTDGWHTEKPAHKVRISRPFYLGKYEVTQRQWKAVMGNNPSRFKGDDRPVEKVSWKDVQAFIRKLNAREGEGTSYLPTEAEWEYAARAGTTTAYSFGNDPEQLGKYAWYRSNSGFGPHPVGQLKPNAWGLYDMHGNVWEWVADRWHNNYKTAPNDGRAWTDDPRGASWVIRGGGWSYDAQNCRAAIRSSLAPVNRDYDLGFRLARSVALGP